MFGPLFPALSSELPDAQQLFFTQVDQVECFQLAQKDKDLPSLCV